jgi:hypothetical protein
MWARLLNLSVRLLNQNKSLVSFLLSHTLTRKRWISDHPWFPASCRETLSSLAEGRKKNKTREVQARYRRCLG